MELRAFRKSLATGLLGALLLSGAPHLSASTPQEVFRGVSPSIVVIEARSSAGKVTATGSGIVVAPESVATNCHVIKGAASIAVRQSPHGLLATVVDSRQDRDVCTLSVKGLNSRPAIFGSSLNLAVGSKVYALGAPKGLSMTFSEGIVSGFRQISAGRVIQFTAPISPGSSGGGLFDDGGRLVGMTTSYIEGGQQLNFAVPVEWIAESIVKSPEGAASPAAEPAADDTLLLRCAGATQKLFSYRPILPGELPAPTQETITVIFDLAKKTVQSDSIPFLYRTNAETGALLGRARITLTEYDIVAELPKVLDDGRGRIAQELFPHSKVSLDRVSGELTVDIHWFTDGFGKVFHQLKGTYMCQRVARRAI